MTAIDPAQNPAESKNQVILLVDDNATNLQVLFKTLSELGHKLLIAKHGPSAISIARQAKPALILLDIMMPDMDGYEVCKRLKADPETRDSTVIFLSALNEVDKKVKGLELGAVDFITKPFQAEEVIARVKTNLTIHALQQEIKEKNENLKQELRVAQELLKESNQRLEGPLLGESMAVKQLRASLAGLAESDEATLLTGTPGSGEEAVARAIHSASRRGSRAFIYVNCALYQAGTPITQLLPRFGSGTSTETQGTAKFDLADEGTIYLDRINDLPLGVQEALLKALEALAEARAAGKKPKPDVRVIAFSSHDLAQEIQALRFSALLAECISKRRLSIPSLGERKDDIPVLADFFIQQHARRLGKAVEDISEASMERLKSYSWPGSIRELQNVLEREVAVAQRPTLEINDAIFEGAVTVGGYKLVRKLGEGGMGEVWLAKHQVLARPAAVKLIHADKLEKDDPMATVKRFQREAKATAHLNSPNTINLYDYGVTDNGIFFYVMELLTGMDLFDMVNKFGPLPPERTIMLLQQACRSLAEAHENGLVHRDVKPDNIFVCKLGTEHDIVKVLDFGIVKGGMGGDDIRLTMDESAMMGTPAYMCPELIKGVGELDGRADLYALGCVAYWMLTGDEVFQAGNAMGVLIKHGSQEPVPPSEVARQAIPKELEEVVLRCLKKDPKDRFATALELWDALGAVPCETVWSQKRARAWWQDHLADLLAGVEAQGQVGGIDTGAETMG